MRAPRAQIEAAQLRQLRALLRAILPGNRFYARKLAAAGFPASAQSPQKLSVFAHRVHQTVATGSQGGDITKGFTVTPAASSSRAAA